MARLKEMDASHTMLLTQAKDYGFKKQGMYIHTFQYEGDVLFLAHEFDDTLRVIQYDGEREDLALQTLARMPQNRQVYFIQETVKRDGEYICCVANEGETGYHKTDRALGSDKIKAEAFCSNLNQQVGIDQPTAYKIVLGTMGIDANKLDNFDEVIQGVRS